MSERYIVRCKLSDRDRWGATVFEDDIKSALDAAAEFFASLLEDHPRVTVEIEEQD